LTIADIPDQKASHATVSKLIESLIEVEKNCLQLTLLSKEPYNGLAQRDIDRFYLNSDGAVRKKLAPCINLSLQQDRVRGKSWSLELAIV